MESGDEIQLCQSVEPHEEEETVKSKAVVKFAQVQAPVKFNRLECNTNLNLPPSNWLTSADSNYGLQQALYHNPGFASFRMAHMFPDCVGEVDVVADAENIKKLLKLPYASMGAVSMTVHKVGNTLLLDEFDIQKYLLRKADDDWTWLRTFIMEQILSYGDVGHNFCLKDKSREAIQTKNLLSKFLYYSLKQSPSCEVTKTSATEAKEKQTALPLTGPLLPEPKVEENVPDPNSSHVFQRNVVWTFEDIRMLIGTDMPIFGGPNRPCISLRLRDMAKPINVLTGIDYWLDNLMCNVPEVVMCYHLDGIVQKYEIIKTEDLPHLEDSQFSPQVVKNVAQNILSFLKANATKEGHTYWLFKGRNDDVVKLYDLTTLCKNQQSNANDECDDTQGNPFTVPVAMLLYTVARNMKNRHAQISAKTAGNIRALLDNCIKLLPKEKYPQIVTSSHYILSDLHIPAGIDPKDPKFDVCDNDSDTQSVYEEEEEGDEEDDFEYEDTLNFRQLSKEQNVAVQNICDTLKDITFESQPKTKMDNQRPSPLIASIEDRCLISLQHINQGLSCLQFFNKNEECFIKESEARAKDEEKQRILHEEQNPNMAKPFKPIPLPYETLSSPSKWEMSSENPAITPELETKTKKSKLKKSHSKDLKPLLTSQTSETHNMPPHQIAVSFNSQLFGSWNVHLKLLLLEKACLTYATLAEHNYVQQKFGLSLRYIYKSCKCQHVVLKYVSTMVSQKRCLLGRAGDCLFQMAKNWENIDENLKDFHKSHKDEKYIDKELEKELDIESCPELIVPQENVEHLMVSSCACYENALEEVNNSASKDNTDEEACHELLRRLGNVRNELGVKYMFWSQEQYTKHMEEISENNAEQQESVQKLSDDLDDHKDDKTSKEDPLFLKLAMKSYDCLIRGIKAFGLVQDNVNMAFLYCNMGRFMRFRAHLVINNENLDVIQQQKRFYNEAFSYYEKAQDVLGSRKSNAELWDLVNWELSTATFTLAKQLQDCSRADEACRIDLEKEVLDLLQKSLKLCDVEHPGSRQIVYTYRSGLIHQRIASFHHSQLRNNFSDSTTLPKTTLQLCKYHYEKAASILDGLREAADYLVVQLERISLQEFLAENSLHNSQKIKHLQQVLDTCLNSKPLFEYALSNWNSSADNGQQPAATASNAAAATAAAGTSNGDAEFQKHILLFESRLQNALKTLIKLWLTAKDPKQKADLYKKMYMETLNIRKVTGPQHEQTSVDVLAQQFANLLERLTQMERIHANNLNNNHHHNNNNSSSNINHGTNNNTN
ncbi:erythroid differentiation-related factor 1 [Stomoxys calcitrans]|uniref:erythroid differentiation-related factor 1 n=1 Tax=Stomoxys calcitrans TaxID=35570 RepID=UPI0027E30C79|nr:erythroid differentiation-related factor 1 [Stomoxys calcitrans]